MTVVPFATHPTWCDPARCYTDRGHIMHESALIQIGHYDVRIMGDDEGPPAVMLDDETLSPAEARHRAIQLEALAAELRRHADRATDDWVPRPVRRTR